jgi:alkylation response protein AidB-like acyl-CoA dehydrogenase
VDFDLSADQIALKEAARDLLEGLAPLERLRARVGPGTVVGSLPGAPATEADPADAPSGYDADLWAAMAEQGWLALERPEDRGGLGLSTVEVAVLAEEVGRALAPAPWAETVLALGALDDAGDDEASSRADALAAGEQVGCVAFCPGPGDLTLTGGRLSGTTAPVVYAPTADVTVVALAERVVAVALPPERRPAPEPAMDRTRELGRLTFRDDPALDLGGPEAVDRLVDRAATLTSAALLGGAAEVLDRTVAYAKDRVQFGKPIGSFQAVKHRLADALVDVEGMRSTAYYAAWCTSADDPEAHLAASMAKAWCTDASRRVLAAGLQVHGGIGFTWEHDLHLFLKRAQLDQVSFGDAAWHRDRIAGLLRDRLDRGADLL